MDKKMMLKRNKLGRYTIYKDIEVRIGRETPNKGGKTYVYVNDNMLDIRCYKNEYGSVVRNVTPEEIGETYEIDLVGTYKGKWIGIMGYNRETKMVCIYSNDKETIKELKMPMVLMGEYELMVQPDEVEVYEQVRYFDKNKYFNHEGFDYYKEELVHIEEPDWSQW